MSLVVATVYKTCGQMLKPLYLHYTSFASGSWAIDAHSNAGLIDVLYAFSFASLSTSLAFSHMKYNFFTGFKLNVSFQYDMSALAHWSMLPPSTQTQKPHWLESGPGCTQIFLEPFYELNSCILSSWSSISYSTWYTIIKSGLIAYWSFPDHFYHSQL